jgi:CubicO group peptidase (beta-lactamase class C family)
MKSKFLLPVLMLACCLSNQAFAGNPARISNTGLDPQISARIASFIHDNMTQWRIPGLAVGIVQDDTLVWSGYFGYAHIDKQIPVSQTTIFRVGSISKIFTAVAMMQLLEKGKFSVDAPIDEFLPFTVFKQKYDCCPKPTFMDVFTHTSGGGEFRSFRPEAMALPAGAQRRNLEELYEPGILTRICPGEKWSYCNYCIGALGLALETMTGESFREYTDRHIFEPLGMSSSSFYENEQILAHVAQGYTAGRKSFSPVDLFVIEDVPAGNVYATVPDMSRFMIALLNGGSCDNASIVSPDTLQYMLTPQYGLDSRLTAMGINFFLRNAYGCAIAEHSGGMPGFISEMLLVPDRKIGIIALDNAESGGSYEAAYGILKILLEYKETPHCTSAAYLWPKLTGDYVSPEPELFTDARFLSAAFGKYKVRIRRGELVLESGRPGIRYPLRQVLEDDPFFYRIETASLSPAYVVFKPGADGQAHSMIIDLNEYVRKRSGLRFRPCEKN